MSISKGDPLKLKVDGFDQSFTGKIYAIEPRIDEATRTIKMRALLQNGNAKLMPGSFAKVDLGLKSWIMR
jgi:membrane fusion protein (multidrug efflux system)